MYSAVGEALKRSIVNPEHQLAPHVNFLTANIDSDAPQKGVADNEKAHGVMRVTRTAPSTASYTPLLPTCHIV